MSTQETETTDKQVDTLHVKTTTDLIQENEMLKVRLDTREKQMRILLDRDNQNEETKKAQAEAERQDLIEHVIIESNSKYTRDELKDKPLSEIRTIHTSVNKFAGHDFASVAAYQAEQDRKKAPSLTVGKWDYRKEEWIGGV